MRVVLEGDGFLTCPACGRGVTVIRPCFSCCALPSSLQSGFVPVVIITSVSSLICLLGFPKKEMTRFPFVVN